MRKFFLQMKSAWEDVVRSVDATITASPCNTLGQITGDIPHSITLVENAVT